MEVEMIDAILAKFRRKTANAKNRASETQDDVIDVAENEGLPSVNRRKGSNRLVTVLGFMFIACVAAVLVVTVNSGTKQKMELKPSDEQAPSRLPPIVIPPPQPVATTSPAVASVPVVPAIAPQQAKTSPTTKTGEEWYERKLSGNLLVDTRASATSSADRVRTAAPESGMESASVNKTELGMKLESTVTLGRSAAMLHDRNFLITKGTSLDCALETAMDSSVPGIVTCRLTRDIYSDNGRILLLDRGSQLVGEYQGGVRQGQARLFVLWTRVKTPNGVIIQLDSPGADALGRSGHEGWVENHFWQRFGAAILMSLVKDGITALAQNSGGSNNTNIYGSTDTGGTKIVEKMLESTINIPPTIIKHQGEHIQIMVARDLDFSRVYGLRLE